MTTTTLERPVPVGVPGESAPAQTVRLSAALRRGARVHPQGRGALYRAGRTCALGAILVGLLGPEFRETDIMQSALLDAIVWRHMGVDLRRIVDLPHTVGQGASPRASKCTMLSEAIMYLNDTAGWTREQIANWLETLGL